MAKRSRPSKARTTFYGTLLMLLFAVVIPWGCRLDTTPLRERMREMVGLNDDDAGED